MLSRRNERILFALGICGLVILGGFIAYKILEFLASVPIFTFVLIGALFFSYLIHPIVAWLRRRMPVAVAIIVVYAAMILVLAFAVYIVSPIIARDAQAVARNAPQLVASGQRLLTDPHDPLTAHLPEAVKSYLRGIPLKVEHSITNYGASIVKQVLPLVVSLVSVLAVFIIVPITAAYMTAESRVTRRAFLALVPRGARFHAGRIIVDLDHVVGGFIRGQLMVAAIVGTLMTLLLIGLHVPYAVLIGVFAGVVDVIPYVGAVAGWIPAFTVAYMTNGVPNALAVTLGIIIINQLEGHIIVPNIVSRTVALTPLGVLLALLLAGEVLGLPGLLIAVPAAGALRVLIIDLTGGRGRPHPAPIVPRTLRRLPWIIGRAFVKETPRRTRRRRSRIGSR